MYQHIIIINRSSLQWYFISLAKHLKLPCPRAFIVHSSLTRNWTAEDDDDDILYSTLSKTFHVKSKEVFFQKWARFLFCRQKVEIKKSMSVIKRQTKKLSAAISQQLRKTSRLKNTHTLMQPTTQWIEWCVTKDSCCGYPGSSNFFLKDKKLEGLCRVCRLIVKMKRELNYYYDDSDHYDYLQLPLSLLYSQGKQCKGKWSGHN